MVDRMPQGPNQSQSQSSRTRDGIVLPVPDRRRSSGSHGEAFKALTDNAPDAVARLSRGGRFLYVNRVVARLFGRDTTELIGRRVGELGLPVEIAVRFLRGIRRTWRTREEESFDFSIDADATRHYTVRIVPEFDDGDVVSSVLAITYDVTQRTEIERQRDALFEREQVARERAEAASRARDQFLAIVSHELRSPLNGIQSWSHVLENQMVGTGRMSPVASRALEGIRAGIDQQVRLIEQLLDATVAMTGDLRLVKEPLSLGEALVTAVAQVRSSAIAKDVALHVDMRLVDEKVDGDALRIRQVFGHLLTNAIKFTPKGGSIWLSARCDDTVATIAVRDSGRGLAPGYQQWLFEPFRQADSSSTRRTGGIGVGLALARRLAELHGGRIVADSAGPHLGTTFTVTLPLLAPLSPDASLETVMRATLSTVVRASDELAGLSAVVIDDQLEAREALSALLHQFGARVAVAASSHAGFALIDQGDTKPDVVICDVAMPEEDGYGFVRRLRHHEAAMIDRMPGARSHTPVIALSAFAEADHAVEAGSAGFDAYLTKPVDPLLLLATLTRLAPRAAKSAS